MNQTVLKITTWGCGNCGYSQNFSPSDDQLWETHINRDVNLVSKRGPVPLGHCPACYTGMNRQKTVDAQAVLDGIVDLSGLSTTTSASDADLEARQTEVRDEDGNAELEQVGERYRFNERTGQVDTVPVMRPRLRDLTDAELTDLKTRRDQNLDDLSAIAVQEM
jgi:predicted  nucleic acid-binding Zn-ribbon protein